MRVLAIDIETAPTMAYVWQLWDQNVGLNQIVQATDTLCFAAKYVGEKKMHFYSVHRSGHDAMIGAAWDLLDEADVLMHWNGRRFDVPHLNREFLLAGLTPPSPYKQVDLMEVAKRQFKFLSNKLEYVSKALGLEGKAQTGGFDLWTRCMAGDALAWKQMERYNRQDVQLLVDLYDVLQPWIPHHPNRALYDGTSGCPTCGAEDSMQRRGFAMTSARRYQKWQCQGCGSYFRSASIKGTDSSGPNLRAVA